MAEYTAFVYKNNKTKTYAANCYPNNTVGIGKTEKEAINNLRENLQYTTNTFDITIKPLYKLALAERRI